MTLKRVDCVLMGEKIECVGFKKRFCIFAICNVFFKGVFLMLILGASLWTWPSF